MKFAQSVFVTITLFLFNTTCIADQLLEVRTVKRVFAEGDSIAGFYTNEGLDFCKWGIMYIDLNNADGTPKESRLAQLSMVLAAKSAQWKIVRMDYILTSESSCRLTALHIE